MYTLDKPGHSRGFEFFDSDAGYQHVSKSYNDSGAIPRWKKIPGELAAGYRSGVPGTRNREPFETSAVPGWTVPADTDHSCAIAACLRRTQFHHHDNGNTGGHLHDQRVGNFGIVLANHTDHSGSAVRSGRRSSPINLGLGDRGFRV